MEEFSLGKTLTLPAWRRLTTDHPFSLESLRETLLGGQAFRWFSLPEEDAWIGVWQQSVAALRLTHDGGLETAIWGGPEDHALLLDYLGLDRHRQWIGKLPLSSDAVVARLAKRWHGVVILRQPPAETLLAYICSANKQIPHIRGMLEALSQRFGPTIPGTPFHALPDWATLARSNEADLRACQLGYRAPYVLACARRLTDHPSLLAELLPLPTAEARERLLRLPGVGPKVADCVLLFGFGRADTFPVDTWIDRALRCNYPDLGNWSRSHLATFARLHFGPAGGLVQQWFFADARANSRKAAAQSSRSEKRVDNPPAIINVP
jgi:N-glycosylase/DNA lyase